MDRDPKVIYECTGCGRVTDDPKKDLSLLRHSCKTACCPERNMVPSPYVTALEADREALGEQIAENDRLKSEIEHLKDLQSPGHARLERIAKAAMQGDWAYRGAAAELFSNGRGDDILRARSAVYVRQARALAAELDGEIGA